MPTHPLWQVAESGCLSLQYPRRFTVSSPLYRCRVLRVLLPRRPLQPRQPHADTSVAQYALQQSAPVECTSGERLHVACPEYGFTIHPVKRTQTVNPN